MLKARLTPSRLIDPATRGAVRIIPTTEPPRSRGLRTMRHFRKFLADILRLFLKRQLTTASYAQRFRRLLEEMGGLWLKAGQLLSYRIDIFSSEFCRELSWLQAQAAGFPSDVARRIIEEELGAPIEQYFDQFEDVP